MAEPKEGYPPWHLPVNPVWIRPPATYYEGGWGPPKGWYQSGLRRHKVKPHYHLIWPKDGKRGSKWGRMKDIIQGKGPDVHLAISADKKDYMDNRPRRYEWGRHNWLNEPGPYGELSKTRGWRAGQAYDFRKRKFCTPNANMWTDAIWQPEPNERKTYPEAVRRAWGDWYQSPFYVPEHLHAAVFED